MPVVNKVRRPWIPEKPKAETNASRGGNADTQFYRQSKWMGIRKYMLRENPLCSTCKKEGRLTPAQMVDHIVPVKEGGDKYELGNLASMCNSCHAKKSAQEGRDRRKKQ